MKLTSGIALPLVLHAVSLSANAFVIPDGEQVQAVFSQHQYQQQQSEQPVGHYGHHRQKESLDNLLRAAVRESNDNSVGNEQQEDIEVAYANAFIEFVEKPSHHKRNREETPSSSSSVSSSLWNIVRESVAVTSKKWSGVVQYINKEDGAHPPHSRPDHPPPHKGKGKCHKPRHHPHNFTDATIYENLGKSNYTKKIFALINEDKELIQILNSTKTNITFFVPTDQAFEKIPEHGKKPSKDFIKALLYYHVSGDFYPAGKVIVSHTIPSLLKEDALGKDELQRLRVGISLRGIFVNFFSKIVLPNIFASNGVIHAIDHILVPPPPALKVLELLPGEFSTLTNALYKTGLIKTLNETDFTGLTIFAPTNNEFKRLGPKILGFLFSKFGEKYLTALLKYHIVPDQTLYSDAWYKPENQDHLSIMHPRIPKGRFHADLKTLLEDRSLSIDIIRWGRIIDYKINAFARVVLQDGVVKDGVIQIPDRVLIPPKTTPPMGVVLTDNDVSLTVEEFKARFDPYIAN